MQDWMNLSWKLLIVRGIVGIVFGIVAMVWPLETVIALALLWGIWALVDSAGSLIQAFDKGLSGGNRVLLIVMAVVALLAGIFAITHPGFTAVALTWLLGIWLIVRGVLEGIAGFSAPGGAAKVLIFLSAAVDLLLGILFVANPGRSAVAVAFLLGLVALVWGVLYLITGFVVRKDVKSMPAAPTA